MTIVFSSVQPRFKKGRDTHIKEIQAFQHYFEIVYRINDLRRTIYDAAVSLKHKFMAKLTGLNIPSCVRSEDKYEFAFNFYPPKFPPLPSADIKLAFRPPFPRWFICGSDIEVLKNESLKLAKRVVSLKHNLHSFKGHLHVNIEHVKVLTLIHEGKRESQ